MGIINRTRHVLGITTYRDRRRENIDLKAFDLFKKNQKRKASKSISKTVNRKLLKKFEKIKIISCNPAIGVYEGGSEPSCIPVFYAESDTFGTKEYNYKLLDMFKRFTKQDSILLYEIVKNGHPAIKIKIPLKKLHLLQIALMKYSNDKIGSYLTYDYVNKSVMILNIKEFDGMTDKQFMTRLANVKPLIKDLGGKLTIFHTKYKIV